MESAKGLEAAARRGAGGSWLRATWVSAAVVALAALAACAFVAQLDPAPHPRSHRDFATLLLADTLWHARLANPAPDYASHLQSPRVLIAPHYVSAEPPLQALFPLLGQALGDPFAGSAVGFALACAALVWMLRAWVSPGFAFAAGLAAALQLHLAEQFGLSLGPASPLLLGSALVFGALARLGREGPPAAIGCALGAGALALAALDPWSAALAALLAAGYWLAFRRGEPAGAGLGFALALFCLGLAWHGYYNYRTTGGLLTSPAALYAERHGTPPELVLQSFDAARSYERPSPSFEESYGERGVEARSYFERQTWEGFQRELPRVLALHWRVFAGVSGSVFLALALLSWREPGLRFALAGLLLFALLAALRSREEAAQLAAAVPFLALITACALRGISRWRIGRLPVGLALAAYAVPIAIADHTEAVQRERLWADGAPLAARAGIEARLRESSPRSLVLVAYRPGHPAEHEWVYNGADPEGGAVVWLREGTAERNAELAERFAERELWLGGSQGGALAVERHPRRVRWWFEREARANPRLREISAAERRALERWYRGDAEASDERRERERILRNVKQLARRGEIPALQDLEGDALARGIEANVEQRLLNRRNRARLRAQLRRAWGLVEERLKALEEDPARDPELAALPEAERRQRLLSRAREEVAEQAADEESGHAQALARALAVYRGAPGGSEPAR